MPRFSIFIVFFLVLSQGIFAQTISVNTPGANPTTFTLSHPEPGTLAFILFGDGQYKRVQSSISEDALSGTGPGTFPAVEHTYPTTGNYQARVFYAERYKDVPPNAIDMPPTSPANISMSGSASSSSMTDYVKISTSWNPSLTSDHITIVSVKNPSNCPRSGNVKFFFRDANLGYISTTGISVFSTSLLPNGSNGIYDRQITMSINLQANEVKHFFLRTRIKNKTSNVKAELNLSNNPICSNGAASVSPATSVLTASESAYPHDPNLKTVNPASICCCQSSPQKLTYTITFQNIGDAPATKVTIEDNLDAQSLDPSTVVLESSSHPATDSLSGNTLNFTFDPIDLPGTGQNPSPDSSATVGSFTFSVMTGECLQPGFIFNQAKIIFDDLPPIETSVAVVEIIDCELPSCNSQPMLAFPPGGSGTNATTASPNPFQSHLALQFEMDETEAPLHVTVHDLLGKIVANPLEGMYFEAGKHEETLNLSHLQPGFYLLSLRQSGRLETLRIVKK